MNRTLFISLLTLGVTTPLFSQDRRVPHYFPEGIEKITVPALQFEAYGRYINATGVCLGTGRAWRTFSNSLRVEREIEGKKVIFVFDPWIRTGSNRIIFQDFCGQRNVTESDFQFVLEDLFNEVRLAVQAAYDYHNDLEKLAVRAKAENSDSAEASLRRLLDKPVSEASGITYRELFQLPTPMKKSDFVPKEVHLGYGQFLGATWLNSGIVYITLQGRILDELMGGPRVMTHELVHANPNLQRYPLSNGIDLELMASVPEMFLPDDKISLAYHGYLSDIREMVRVFFGFNFDQVRKEIVVFNYAGNMRLDLEKFNLYFGKLEEVKAELLRFFREVALPQFYSDPVFWTSMNNKMVDDISVFRIMMAMNYDPVILGGHENTMNWLRTREPEIRRMAHQAFTASGNPSEDSKEGHEGVNNPSRSAIRALINSLGMREEDLIRMARKYNIKEKDLLNKSLPELLQMFLMILNEERPEERR